MKKVLVLVLALILALALFGCKDLSYLDEDKIDPNQSVDTQDNTQEDITMTGNNPQVTITMKNGGVIKLELYPNIAPESVNNFIYLINQKFYDGLIFHRVIKDFMIQGGCPEGTGFGNPGYSIKGEFMANGVKNSLKHSRGVLSMARGNDYDTAGSQFFIVHQDAFFLDGQYAAFGMVTEGMDVVDAIATTQTDNADKPVEDQTIDTITVDTFGVTYPEPNKIG